MFVKLFLSVILLSFSISSIAQEIEKPLRITGDKFVNSSKDGESIRGFYGNVVLVEGEVTITCNEAIEIIALAKEIYTKLQTTDADTLIDDLNTRIWNIFGLCNEKITG